MWECVKCAVCARRCPHTKLNPDCAWSCPDHSADRVYRRKLPEDLKDSGERVTISTGAVRDSATGRGRPDLISPIMMERLAIHLERGAQKYEERNWERGLSISRCFASPMRHTWRAFQGMDDEDHLAAVICNAMFILHILEMIKRGRLPAELNDLPRYEPVDEPDLRESNHQNDADAYAVAAMRAGKPDSLDGKSVPDSEWLSDSELDKRTGQAKLWDAFSTFRNRIDLACTCVGGRICDNCKILKAADTALGT